MGQESADLQAGFEKLNTARGGDPVRGAEDGAGWTCQGRDGEGETNDDGEHVSPVVNPVENLL